MPSPRRSPSLAHEGRALDAHEDHVVAAEAAAALRVARRDAELARGLGDLLEHEVRVELDELALDRLAGLAEQLERGLPLELDADVADDRPPALLEDGHRLLRQHLVARQRVDEHGGQHRSQPLTPVTVTPSTNARWARKKSSVTGNVKSTQAAIISS